VSWRSPPIEAGPETANRLVPIPFAHYLPILATRLPTSVTDDRAGRTPANARQDTFNAPISS
jgi:hypothetical protein